MESQTPPPPSSDTPASTAGDIHRRWVILLRNGECEVAADDNSHLDDKTAHAAASHTSTGHPIRVSAILATPPSVSRLRYHTAPTNRSINLQIIAAHGDSVLIQIDSESIHSRLVRAIDHFVYKAGAGGAAPSLSTPPPYWLTEEDLKKNGWTQGVPRNRRLSSNSTGILRRVEDDELVVADRKAATAEAAEILLLRSGEWSVKRAPITFHDLTSWKPPPSSPPATGCSAGSIYTSASSSPTCSTKSPRRGTCRSRGTPRGRRRRRHVVVCVTGGDTLKFVDVSPRCCCGSLGVTTKCAHSRNAYVITTWTLTINDDDMAWVMDAMVDATELWALDAYRDAALPRVPLLFPVVSMDDAHLITFFLGEEIKSVKTVWVAIVVDMRSKTIRSITRYPEGSIYYSDVGKLLPSRISCYFDNNNPRHRSSNNSNNLQQQISPKPHTTDDQQLLQLSSSSKVVVCDPKEMFMALEEIPGLAREDLLKAYSILARDDGSRLFRFLFGLPVSLRKDWLLMEIKNSELFTCSICSTCKGGLQHVEN
uniref:DUF1618 domain-containing protein n=1 Tax=Leersia perrieri TaxID=77586 RepID=A0A0D9XPJ3_9ORYZ